MDGKRLIAIACVIAAACRDNGRPAPTAPTAPATAAASTRGRIVETSFFSEALGVDKSYLVYLPAGYEGTNRRFPVIYQLHGLGGHQGNWAEHGKLPEAADRIALAAIVVMPDGDTGFYANSVTAPDYDKCLAQGNPFSGRRPEDPRAYCVKHARYEDYIVRDLVSHVDATYRTIPERRARAIGGLSMGGFGALMLAMRHRDVFASAASHSGVAALLYAGPHPYERGKVTLADDVTEWGRSVGPIGTLVRGIFGDDLANWRAHDPAVLATSLSDGDLAIYLDCGTEDRFALQDGAQYLHEVLTERGVHHRFVLEPGEHDFAFWSARIDDSLAFHAEAFAAGAK